MPRFDCCEIYGGRVSTPTFRGWRFLPEFESFRGIGSSESTRFPEGLVLGNSGKTLHPRSVGFAGFHEISFQIICENSSWIWLFRVNLLTVAGWSNLRRSGILNPQSSGIRELAKLCVQTPEIRELWVKDSGIWGKPSQRRNFKKSGFSVWTSGRLVNVWNQPSKSRDVKDIHVHVHTRNIP
jgi:hypothetical protein